MSTFYKLVSNLPFHPSVLGELTFYSRRLLKEEKLRRLGFFFMSLLLVMQVFGFISPPKPSLATSTNDIIYGATTKDAVLKAYNQNRDSLGRKDIKSLSLSKAFNFVNSLLNIFEIIYGQRFNSRN